MRAAQYLRMSTEHQQYSLDNQSAAIGAYAAAHNFQIVETYSDEARSGLRLRDRPGLRQLIEDVNRGRADFGAVLVFDVSRWGRFQDADESAHYEFLCKLAGIRVHYCAEQFLNDGSVAAALLKALKRTMAGEYSRELSEKVFAGQCRIVQNGFKIGGRAGWTVRRHLEHMFTKTQTRSRLELGLLLTRKKRKFLARSIGFFVPVYPACTSDWRFERLWRFRRFA